VCESWRDHAERRSVQTEHVAGRARPASTRHPPQARAGRTTASAAHRTDSSGSGKPFIISELAYTAKDRRVTNCHARDTAANRIPESTWVEVDREFGHVPNLTSKLRGRVRTELTASAELEVRTHLSPPTSLRTLDLPAVRSPTCRSPQDQLTFESAPCCVHNDCTSEGFTPLATRERVRGQLASRGEANSGARLGAILCPFRPRRSSWVTSVAASLQKREMTVARSGQRKIPVGGEVAHGGSGVVERSQMRKQIEPLKYHPDAPPPSRRRGR
jgi:hypothetical protein